MCLQGLKTSESKCLKKLIVLIFRHDIHPASISISNLRHLESRKINRIFWNWSKEGTKLRSRASTLQNCKPYERKIWGLIKLGDERSNIYKSGRVWYEIKGYDVYLKSIWKNVKLSENPAFDVIRSEIFTL